MRMQYILHVAAGGVLCVPAFVTPSLSQGRDEALNGALAQTKYSLDVLDGLRADLAAGDVSAIRRLRGLTEAPEATPALQQEDRLATLRRQVAQLDEELARLEASAQGAESTPAAATGLATDPAAVGTTTGLDAELRKKLERNVTGPRPSSAFAVANRAHHEDEGYVADDLRLGRALYRAGKFGEAAALLSRLEARPEASYWHARALEKLGKSDAALASYTQTISLEPGGPWALRAKRDAEFLRWQIDFDRHLQRP